MISGFTPTWYPQRRGVGQHVPGGYGHLVQNCKVKGFRCSWSRVRVQICSGLKDRGRPARPSGLDPSGLAEQNCSGLLLGMDVGANPWKNHYKNHYNIQRGLSLSDFNCNFAESVIALTTSGLGERFHTMALMFFR